MAYCIENDLHKMFSRSCVLGEWFDLTEYKLDRLKLQLKFEKDKLNIIGCDTKQRIYSELYVKTYSSSQGIEEILVEMANHKFKVEA